MASPRWPRLLTRILQICESDCVLASEEKQEVILHRSWSWEDSPVTIMANIVPNWNFFLCFARDLGELVVFWVQQRWKAWILTWQMSGWKGEAHVSETGWGGDGVDVSSPSDSRSELPRQDQARLGCICLIVPCVSSARRPPKMELQSFGLQALETQLSASGSIGTLTGECTNLSRYPRFDDTFLNVCLRSAHSELRCFLSVDVESPKQKKKPKHQSKAAACSWITHQLSLKYHDGVILTKENQRLFK